MSICHMYDPNHSAHAQLSKDSLEDVLSSPVFCISRFLSAMSICIIF